jgi:hypothetical protein
MNFRRFYDPPPNGGGVMSVGACLPKKRMEHFLRLARRILGPPFDFFCAFGKARRFSCATSPAPWQLASGAPRRRTSF